MMKNQIPKMRRLTRRSSLALQDNIQTQISIPTNLTPQMRITLGDKMVDEIVRRTRSGIDKRGRAFVKYNPEYVAEKGSSKVDLTDTGDSLDELAVLEIGLTYITVGYAMTYPEADQIEGLNIGASGKPGVRGNSKKARPFIGLPQSTVDLLVAQVRRDFKSGEGQLTQKKSSFMNAFIARLLKEVGIEQ